jgi:uncharacterized membrane protein YhhN
MNPAPDTANDTSVKPLGPPEWLMIAIAALSTLSATLDWTMLHFASKPMAMLLAVLLVLRWADASHAGKHFKRLLVAALLASLAGDVFLMLPGNYFIPGLASFLVAHLFYIALFRQGVPWFVSHRALLGTLAVGTAMYAWVWPGLGDPVLKVAVACYVGVISLMVAQAMGRALSLGNRAATAVALGAILFMLSDSLIAIDRFVMPLPLTSLWVLSSYYAAQLLIVHNARARPD